MITQVSEGLGSNSRSTSGAKNLQEDDKQLTGTSIAFLYGFPFRLPLESCLEDRSGSQSIFVELPKPEEVTGNHTYSEEILTASWEYDQLKKIELGSGKVKRYMLQKKYSLHLLLGAGLKSTDDSRIVEIPCTTIISVYAELGIAFLLMNAYSDALDVHELIALSHSGYGLNDAAWNLKDEHNHSGEDPRKMDTRLVVKIGNVKKHDLSQTLSREVPSIKSLSE